MLANPSQRGPAVVHAGWERMLGRESVIDGYHDGLRTDGMRSRDQIVGIQIAERPAAAVVVDDDRQVGVLGDRRPVDADRDVGEITMTDGAFLDPHVRKHFRGCLQLAELLAGHFDPVVDGERQRKRVE